MSEEKGGGEPPKDLRCGHNDGKGWQCKRWKFEDEQHCQQHHKTRSNTNNIKDEEIIERVLEYKSNNKITEKQVEEEIMGSRWGLRPRKEINFAKIADDDEEEDDDQPFFVKRSRKNVGKKRNKDGQAGKHVKVDSLVKTDQIQADMDGAMGLKAKNKEEGQPFRVKRRRMNVGKKRNKDGQAGKLVKSCMKVAINFVSPENVNECISLAQEFRKLPQNHRAKQDKLEVLWSDGVEISESQESEASAASEGVKVASRESGAKVPDDECMEMAESSEPSDADAMQKAPFNADFGVFDTSFSASKGDVVLEKLIVEGVTDTHSGSIEVSGIVIAPEYRILYDNLCKKFGRIDVDTKVPYLRQTYAALTHGLLRGISVMMSADKSDLSLVAVDEWINIVEFAKSARFNVEWLSSPLLKMREFVTGGRMELCPKGEALATAIGTEAEVTRQLAQARKIVSDLENQPYSAEASRKSLELEVADL
ncbi:hypothetical protein IFM89_007704 [Coptis chinensis]|uniref:WRC domain-containing protein n=1 Tax=Coptis chinensis TaxID=261450 RepID=A0A835IUT5_9MAGN|nr:hypothetical protein IFM89_007704 [Coptis chinensis]